jgi:hypothetical protein
MNPTVVITSRETPSSVCLYCFRLLDAATGLNRVPAPGMFTMCAYCHNVMVFDERLHMRKMTENERQIFESDSNIRAQFALYQDAMDSMNKGPRN